ncbi:hypothetical protein GQ53DRAFT_740291 [Thozetella sp. PMI_491]|nr:hypothetical protein GQ53DRAFT_740291 [Thozetella sp. PMI_491]
MWAQLPPGVWVSALITILYTFLCLFANVLMLWLTWVHHERLSYIALIGYLTLLCTICSIVQQMYEYEHWEEFMWEQHHHIQANPNDANAWFNNGNFGFRLVLSNIRLFTNNATAAMALSFSMSIAGTVYGFWATHQRIEKHFNLYAKILPILLAAISVALLQAPAVQRNWPAYMVIANGLSVLSCVLSFCFFVAIVVQYVQAKRTVERWRGWLQYKAKGIVTWLQSSRDRERRRRRRRPDPDSSRPIETNTGTNVSWARMSLNPHSIYDGWLVTRLSILALMLWVFILVTLITHIQEKDHVTKDAQAPAPNLTSGYASDAILGYMPAVTPGLLLFIVFGTTKTLRQTMYETFMPRCLRRRRQQRRTSRHVQLQTPSSQRSPYLQGVAPPSGQKHPPLPPGVIELDLGKPHRDDGPALNASRDIEMGDWIDGGEETRSRSRIRRASKPPRAGSVRSTEDGDHA